MRKHIGNESKRRGARKTMAVVLCACMMGTMLPGTALAKETEIVSVKLQTEPAQSTSENTVSENAPELTRPEEASQELTTAEGYDAEGFCTGYIWENGELELVLNSEGGNQCPHGEICNGYQPATLEAYDVDGNGTTDDDEKAYKITNAGQLYWFAAYVNEGGEHLNANAYMVNDITVNRNLLSRIQENETTGEITNDEKFRKWVPIGDSATDEDLIYEGMFDGDNHKIKGIYINETSKNQGVFGRQSGTIENLVVEDSEIIGLSYIGGIVGSSLNGGIITNCKFYGEVISLSKTENSCVGGICGANAGNAAITKCENNGRVKGYYSRVGGITGQNVNVIEECTNVGKVEIIYSSANASERGYTGGIVGLNLFRGNSQGKIMGCFNEGEVTGNSAEGVNLDPYVGGIVGKNEGAKISICFNKGEIKGECQKSGISGQNLKEGTGKIGIIINCGDTGAGANERKLVCGNGSACEIKNCYISGGSVGSFESNSVECVNIFYLSENGETDSYEGTTAMTSADFASGKVAYLLQQAQEVDAETGKKPQVWYQNIDNGSTKDNYPVLDSTHGKVYQCLNCTSVYSNTENKIAVHADVYQNPKDSTTHICTKCGKTEKHQAVFTADESRRSISGKCGSCNKELGTLTLTAPSGTLTENGKAKTASVSGTMINVAIPAVTYVKVESNGAETPLSGAPKAAGTYKAKITCGSGKNTTTVTVKITITRQKPVKGKTYQDDSGKATYKVTGSGRKGNTVAYKAPVNKNAKTVSIPATVKIGGITFKVTEIAKGAFKNSKKLQKVIIGKNVVTIGKQAFYGCKKLKTVTINTTKLTAKRVGSGAFSKTPKNMTVKVPKKKYKAYREILTQKGVKKTAQIKKK